MKFDMKKALEILFKTPLVLETMLSGLSHEWIKSNEGEDSWSPYDVIGHLIHGEKTDWLIRIKIIMSDNPKKEFEAFDRFSQLKNAKTSSIEELLHEFKELRMDNLIELKQLNLTPDDYSKTGIHPDFGLVTLQQILATWVVHDLNHIAQISRVMSKQYQHEVGPWKAYLGILKTN